MSHSKLNPNPPHTGRKPENMRTSNKSRSRNKNQHQNRRTSGNIINRVFDSSGPEGKVRGTPQQIVEKYQMLARDAQLSGDRVAAENFQQHSEHYARLLSDAMREQSQRREQQEAQRRDQQVVEQKPVVELQNSEQPDLMESPEATAERSSLVETPEEKPRRRQQKPVDTRREKPNEEERIAE